MIATLFRNTLTFTIAASATVLIVAGSAAPVQAASFGTAPSRTINTAGIDLTSAAGQARVTAEVKRAARRVCSTGGDNSAQTAAARAACVRTALAKAMPQVQQLASAQRDARAALAEAGSPTAPVAR